MRREEKRTKFSSTNESSREKQQKAKRCLSSLLTPVTKTACALDKAFAATIEGSSSLGESHRSARIHHVHHSHHRRRENSNFGTMFFESPGMPRMNLANDFGDDFAEMRGTKRSWEEEDLHTPAPRQTTTANNATTTATIHLKRPLARPTRSCAIRSHTSHRAHAQRRLMCVFSIIHFLKSSNTTMLMIKGTTTLRMTLR